MTTPEIVMVARSSDIADWVKACAERRLSFDELCSRVAAKGYKTNSLYEAVLIAELSIEKAAIFAEPCQDITREPAQ